MRARAARATLARARGAREKTHQPSNDIFVRVREGVPKRVNARDENEINNTGFGVNRYRCVHTPVLEVRQ